MNLSLIPRLAAVALGILSLSLTACDSGDEGSSCTLIGCASDGLRIELTDANGGPAPAGHYRITVVSTTPPGQNQCDFDLPSAGSDPACRVGASGVSFQGYAPTSPTLIVAHDQTPAFSGEVTVTYTVTRPNGPGCDPECRDGVVTIPVQ